MGSNNGIQFFKFGTQFFKSYVPVQPKKALKSSICVFTSLLCLLSSQKRSKKVRNLRFKKVKKAAFLCSKQVSKFPAISYTVRWKRCGRLHSSSKGNAIFSTQYPHHFRTRNWIAFATENILLIHFAICMKIFLARQEGKKKLLNFAGQYRKFSHFFSTYGGSLSI